MLYFAYGSNMLTERLRNRVPSAEPVGPARVPGRTLRFHKRSRDGSGKCNLVDARTASAAVHGVLFDIDTGDLGALDEAENRGRGYDRTTIDVQISDESVDAFVYLAQPAYIDDALRPYDWYHALVLAGAYQHGLPVDYRTELEAVRTYPDPKDGRRAKYESLLGEAGFLHVWPEA